MLRNSICLSDIPRRIAMQLLTPIDVAAILQCGKSTVYALKDAGRLPFVHVGALIRFRRQDVDEFIANNLMIRSKEANTPPGPSRLKHLRA